MPSLEDERYKKEDVEGFVKIVSARNQVDLILGGQLNVGLLYDFANTDWKH